MEFTDPTDSFSRRQKHLIHLLNCEMTGAQRLAISGYLTHWEIERSRAAIAKAHPELSPRDLKLKWVEITYGAELATGFRAELDRRAILGEYPLG